MTLPRIAIIGAGLSGLVLAHEINRFATVTLFEKSRGVSGRMATRYAEPYEFDHGAQFFTAKTEAFQTFLGPWVAEGTVTRWDAAFVELSRHTVASRRQWDNTPPHYVPHGRMNALGRALAEGLDIRLRTRVADFARKGEQWELNDGEGNTLGAFDWVISTAPPAQATALLPDCFAHHEALMQKAMLPCYSLMLGFDAPLPLPWQAALVHDADISWISVNSSKPGRPELFALMVHSTNRWAAAHINDDREEVTRHLMQETSDVTGHDVSQAGHIALHSWLYANIEKQTGPEAYVDAAQRLIACGDWCVHGRVEGAFTSAMAAASELRVLLDNGSRPFRQAHG